MSASVLAIAAPLAAMAAWWCARALCSGAGRHERALDATWGGPQKLHARPTPRIGGIAVAAGIATGTAVLWAMEAAIAAWIVLLLCVAPGFAWGFIEDVTKRGDVLVRLVLTGVSAAIAFFLLDARITQIDVPIADRLLAYALVAFCFTLFAVAGVSHAINVVDGLNGLSGFTSLLASAGLALVAWKVGDSFVATAACVLAAAVAGFLVVNFPSGRIFLGDGGAYLVGLLLAELSVLLVHRNSEVSVWFPLLLLAYPIWETLFSAYRRHRMGRSAGSADALHMHTLVYRRVVRWTGFRATPAERVARNSMASLCLWLMPLACWGVAVAFWDSSPVLQAAAMVYALSYTILYRALVRFRVPAWLVVRARPAKAPIDAENATEVF